MSRKEDSYQLRKWSILARRNAKGICECCNTFVGFRNLNTHHANCYRYYPEERFLQSNAVCLCYKCHEGLHNIYKINWHYKTTRDDYERFKKIVNLHR